MNLENSNRGTDTKNAFEEALRDAFDARNGMRPIESNNGLPIVRRPECKLKVDSVSVVWVNMSLS